MAIPADHLASRKYETSRTVPHRPAPRKLKSAIKQNKQSRRTFLKRTGAASALTIIGSWSTNASATDNPSPSGPQLVLDTLEVNAEWTHAPDNNTAGTDLLETPDSPDQKFFRFWEFSVYGVVLGRPQSASGIWICNPSLTQELPPPALPEPPVLAAQQAERRTLDIPEVKWPSPPVVPGQSRANLPLNFTIDDATGKSLADELHFTISFDPNEEELNWAAVSETYSRGRVYVTKGKATLGDVDQNHIPIVTLDEAGGIYKKQTPTRNAPNQNPYAACRGYVFAVGVFWNLVNGLPVGPPFRRLLKFATNGGPTVLYFDDINLQTSETDIKNLIAPGLNGKHIDMRCYDAAGEIVSAKLASFSLKLRIIPFDLFKTYHGTVLATYDGDGNNIWYGQTNVTVDMGKYATELKEQVAALLANKIVLSWANALTQALAMPEHTDAIRSNITDELLKAVEKKIIDQTTDEEMAVIAGMWRVPISGQADEMNQSLTYMTVDISGTVSVEGSQSGVTGDYDETSTTKEYNVQGVFNELAAAFLAGAVAVPLAAPAALGCSLVCFVLGQMNPPTTGTTTVGTYKEFQFRMGRFAEKTFTRAEYTGLWDVRNRKLVRTAIEIAGQTTALGGSELRVQTKIKITDSDNRTVCEEIIQFDKTTRPSPTDNSPTMKVTLRPSGSTQLPNGP